MQHRNKMRLRVNQLALCGLCWAVNLTASHGQVAPPPTQAEVFEETAPSLEERSRNILEAEATSAVAVNSSQFLGEVIAVLAELIAAPSVDNSEDASDPLKVFIKANDLIRVADEQGTWGIQFSSNISPAAFFINTLISPRAGSVAPGLSHADFALTVLR
ncbi:MAG: hypothetical protein ACI9R3_005149, partial [Verrucomicrobiales bacterium]